MFLAVFFTAVLLLPLGSTSAKADGEDEVIYDISDGDIVITVDSNGKQMVSIGGGQAVEVTKSIVIISTTLDSSQSQGQDEFDGLGSTNAVSISVEEGSTVRVTLRDVSIVPEDKAPITVSGEGTAIIELDGTLNLKASWSEHAGIEKTGNGTLVITDTDQNGELWVYGGTLGGAGIGSRGPYTDDEEFLDALKGDTDEVEEGFDVSNITIEGGEIHAFGGRGAAGIGGGFGGSAENITISGGFVSARSAVGGAGIGGGINGKASGIVVKNDAIVIAVSQPAIEIYPGCDGIGYGGQAYGDYGASAFTIEDGKPVPNSEIIDISGLYDVGYIGILPYVVVTEGVFGEDYLNNLTGFFYEWMTEADDELDADIFDYIVSGDIKTYNLWVGGTLVSEKNCSDIPVADGYTKAEGKASFDPASNTLTLDNYQYEGPGHRAWTAWGYSFNNMYRNPTDTYAAIYYSGKMTAFQKACYGGYMPLEEDTLTIVLKGENSVKQDGDWAKSCGILIGDEDPDMYYSSLHSIADENAPGDYGIHLVITGDGKGSLISEADDAAAPQQYKNDCSAGSSAGDPWVGGYTRGIAVLMGKLKIDGADVEAIGGDTDSEYSMNTNYREVGYRYTGGVFCAFGLDVINDGTLVAQAGDAPKSNSFSFGIETGGDCNFESGVVKAFGGTVKAPKGYDFGGSGGIVLSLAYTNYGDLAHVIYMDDGAEGWDPTINIGTGITTVEFAGGDMATDLHVIDIFGWDDDQFDAAGAYRLKNKVVGEGWFTFDGSDDSTAIKINESNEGQYCGVIDEEETPFLRAKFHQHQFLFTASGDTITVSCADETCELSGLALTIKAPAEDALAYDGTAKAATLNDYDETAFSNAGSIVYTKDGEAVSADKVVDAGKYKATVTVTDGDETYTAEVEFEITKKELTEDDLKTFGTEIPTGLTGVYGQKLEEIKLPEATKGDNGGTWAWSKSDTVLGPVGEQTYEATFTQNNTNYTAGTFKITVKVLPKDVKVTADDASKTYSEKDPELTATVDGLIGEDTIEYSLSRASGENTGTYVITASGEQTQGNYTVTFANGIFTIEKAKAPEKLGDDEQPKANDLSENDTDQPLVTAPEKLPDGYTKIQYSDDGGKTWKDTIPTGKEPGEYTIQVRYIGDGNHEDFTGTPVKVTIKAVYTVIWLNPDETEFAKKTYGEGETEPQIDTTPSKAEDDNYKYTFLEWEKASEEGHTKTYKPIYAAIPKNLYIIDGTFEWTKGSGSDIVITVKRTVGDQTCFSHFKAVKIGDTVIVLGEDYDAKAGSTVITLKTSALEKLESGDHPVTVIFDDGEAKAVLTVKDVEPTPNPVDPDPKKSDSANTGDSSTLLIWLILAVVSAGAAGGVYAKMRLRGRA